MQRCIVVGVSSDYRRGVRRSVWSLIYSAFQQIYVNLRRRIIASDCISSETYVARIN